MQHVSQVLSRHGGLQCVLCPLQAPCGPQVDPDRKLLRLALEKAEEEQRLLEQLVRSGAAQSLHCTSVPRLSGTVLQGLLAEMAAQKIELFK